MRKLVVVMAVSLGVVGCRTTKPGTDVQVVDDNGTKRYVGGAAGPGMNQGIACDTAVNRAVAAIALRFTQDNDDLADDVAKDVGVDDGRVFLQRYAKAKLQQAAVQDVSFDPGQHLCMATVRWTPPVFVKDAVKEYAEEAKREEQHPNQPAAAAAAQPATSATGTPSVQTPTPPAPTTAGQGAPTVTGEPTTGGSSASGAPASSAAPTCPKERDRVRKSGDALRAAQDELDECMRRTNGNATTCTRYKLYVDQAKQKDDSAHATLDRCTRDGR